MQFRDDGGTPAWRARQRERRPGLVENWRRMPFGYQVVLVVFFGWGLPWLIIIIGLLGMLVGSQLGLW